MRISYSYERYYITTTATTFTTTTSTCTTAIWSHTTENIATCTTTNTNLRHYCGWLCQKRWNENRQHNNKRSSSTLTVHFLILLLYCSRVVWFCDFVFIYYFMRLSFLLIVDPSFLPSFLFFLPSFLPCVRDVMWCDVMWWDVMGCDGMWWYRTTEDHASCDVGGWWVTAMIVLYKQVSNWLMMGGNDGWFCDIFLKYI
jgi:hypothetical protein